MLCPQVAFRKNLRLQSEIGGLGSPFQEEKLPTSRSPLSRVQQVAVCWMIFFPNCGSQSWMPVTIARRKKCTATSQEVE